MCFRTKANLLTTSWLPANLFTLSFVYFQGLNAYLVYCAINVANFLLSSNWGNDFCCKTVLFPPHMHKPYLAISCLPPEMCLFTVTIVIRTHGSWFLRSGLKVFGIFVNFKQQSTYIWPIFHVPLSNSMQLKL